jgi:hypothetical protein
MSEKNDCYKNLVHNAYAKLSKDAKIKEKKIDLESSLISEKNNFMFRNKVIEDTKETNEIEYMVVNRIT